MSQLESAGRMLKVTEARQEDSGKYTCLATNAAGEAQQHIRLSVHGNFEIHTALSPGFCHVHLISGTRGGARRVSSDKSLFLYVSLRAAQYPPLWRANEPDHLIRLSH